MGNADLTAVGAAVIEQQQSAGMLELDHVILFGRGIDDTPLETAGFTLEAGRRGRRPLVMGVGA
jgi:hypothetical protein